MPKVREYAPGTFCWTDLATTDAEGAKKFYTAVFGWEYRDNVAGENMVYSMALLQGEEVAALYRMEEGELQRGGQPRWQSYVSVASADEAAQKAQTLGGTMLAAPFDVFEHGRMAAVSDPCGGIFNLWEPRAHIGATLSGENGTRCWNELMVQDTEKAKAFYTGLFGWSAREMEGGIIPYTILSKGEEGVAGLMGFPPDCTEPTPGWLVYFLTWDCDGSAAKVEQAGGKVLKPPTDIPTVGRFAIAADPQGGVFALFKPQM